MAWIAVVPGTAEAASASRRNHGCAVAFCNEFLKRRGKEDTYRIVKSRTPTHRIVISEFSGFRLTITSDLG